MISETTYVLSLSWIRQTTPAKSKDGGSSTDISTSDTAVMSSPGPTNHAILLYIIEDLILDMMRI